jgi:hypothetical protein
MMSYLSLSSIKNSVPSPCFDHFFPAARRRHCCTYEEDDVTLKSLMVFHLRYLLEIILSEKNVQCFRKEHYIHALQISKIIHIQDVR